MNKLVKIYFRCICLFSNKARIKCARKLGVRFLSKPGEERCNILDNPFDLFGTEPYLVTVGEHVEFTNGVRIVTHDGGAWLVQEREEFKNIDFFGPVSIGDNVYIGNNTLILPGVSIGNNCIIGAGAVVTKDLPDNGVYVGVPARYIKSIDEYYRKVKREGCLHTKGLSSIQKRNIIMKSFPSWFKD